MRFLAFAAFAWPCVAIAAPALHVFDAVAIAPDGQHVASIEGDDTDSDSGIPLSLVIRDLSGASATVALPCAPGPDCKPASPSWSHDGTTLAFLLAHPAHGTTEIETVGVAGGAPHRVLSFGGPMDSLRYGPADRLAVLATANAHKNLGRTEAGAPLVGEIGAAIDEQRIAIVEAGRLRFVSPENLYVYEYDFSPDGGFVGTAAPGDGDSQWWVAKLYEFTPAGAARVLFTPPPREQLDAPAVSPDGKSVAFIGGWMSDFGSTGGDAYLLPLGQVSATPRNLTKGLRATVTSIDWHCGPGLTGVTLAGGTLAIARLDAPAGAPLWSAQATLSASEHASISCSPHGVAAALSSFAAPPEIFAGALGYWRALTHRNAGLVANFSARSITWRNDGFGVQGWLLQPRGGAPAAKRPLVVVVHGGPEAAASSQFLPETSLARTLLAQGYAVFEPNYRGSFGQGEAFAAASIQDLGGGDWRDILTGVDAAEHATAIDDTRLGIIGGSYGGYMAMWAVTQTHRFRAAVSHAGVSDWLSIEGEAPQAGSDEVNFGGSVYDNAQPYLKASPIMHMRSVRTPVLITVGERDLECPMPQSQEFNTALQAQGVPSEFYVYPGEGHRLAKAADRDDFRRRTVAWFGRWFK
jgi:dipeptidyl aminopeptidase/acylaminoacyl peptidase